MTSEWRGTVETLRLAPIHEDRMPAAFAKELAAVRLKVSNELAALQPVASLSGSRMRSSLPASLARQSSIRFENQLDGLLEVLASLLERVTLSVGTGQFLDVGHVALGDLLVDGGELQHDYSIAASELSNQALQLPGLASPSARRWRVPRRRGLRPHLLAAVVRSRGNLALGPQLNATTLGRLPAA